jgi:hypothetical protein
MAAGPWNIYNAAKKNLMNGTIDLDEADSNFRMALYTDASNVADVVGLSARSQVTNEVANANGYQTGGKLMVTTWDVGASSGEMRFDADAVVWVASGGPLSGVKFAQIYRSGGQLICYSQLSANAFSVTAGNTLTVTPSSSGIFELN